MFWRWNNTREQQEASQRLVDLLFTQISTHTERASAVLSQVKNILQTYKSIDLNAHVVPSVVTEGKLDESTLPVFPANRQVTPLAAIILSTRPHHIKLAVVDYLLSCGANPVWCAPWQECEYAIAAETGDFEIAKRLFQHTITTHPQGGKLMWRGVYSSSIAVVIRVALGVALPGDDSTAVQTPSRQQEPAIAPPVQQQPPTTGTNLSTENNTTPTRRASQQLLEENLQAYNDAAASSETPAAAGDEDMSWYNDSLEHAHWFFRRLQPETLASIKPWGAPSLVHSMLEAFAEQVEHQAQIKRAQLLDLMGEEEDEKREEKEKLFKECRLKAVSFLLRRLWALLNVVIEAGAPVINKDTRFFPAKPRHAICDHEMIWTAVKTFATAWPDHPWTKDTHPLFHPKFKAATETFLKISSCRGFAVKEQGRTQKKTYWLDMGIVDRIIEIAADDQSHWATVL